MYNRMNIVVVSDRLFKCKFGHIYLTGQKLVEGAISIDSSTLLKLDKLVIQPQRCQSCSIY